MGKKKSQKKVVVRKSSVSQAQQPETDKEYKERLKAQAEVANALFGFLPGPEDFNEGDDGDWF